MNTLPYLLDAEDAIEFFNSENCYSDAARAYVVRTLNQEGYTNLKILEALNIKKGYTVTHLKRVGLLLSEEELSLWHSNPKRISLGHVRAIAKLPRSQREELLRSLLVKKISVRKFESLAKGEMDTDSDISRYENLMSEVIGRQVGIKFNNQKLTGTITLDFFGLDDLEVITKALGFNSQDFI